MLTIIVPILINKGVFEPSYNDLKFTVWNHNYICTNLIKISRTLYVAEVVGFCIRNLPSGRKCVCVCKSLSHVQFCSPPRSSVHEIHQERTGVDSHSLLQGIFLTQGSTWGLLHCRQILYHLSHQGSPGKKHNGRLVVCSWGLGLSLLCSISVPGDAASQGCEGTGKRWWSQRRKGRGGCRRGQPQVLWQVHAGGSWASTLTLRLGCCEEEMLRDYGWSSQPDSQVCLLASEWCRMGVSVICCCITNTTHPPEIRGLKSTCALVSPRFHGAGV